MESDQEIEITRLTKIYELYPRSLLRNVILYLDPEQAEIEQSSQIPEIFARMINHKHHNNLNELI